MLFGTLPWIEWHGLWALVLVALFATEIEGHPGYLCVRMPAWVADTPQISGYGARVRALRGGQ